MDVGLVIWVPNKFHDWVCCEIIFCGITGTVVLQGYYFYFCTITAAKSQCRITPSRPYLPTYLPSYRPPS